MVKYNLNYPVFVQLTQEGLLHWVKTNNEKNPPVAHISFNEALSLKIKDTEYWEFPFNVFCNIFGSKMNTLMNEPCNYWVQIDTSRLLEDNELFAKEDVIKIVAQFALTYDTGRICCGAVQTLEEVIEDIKNDIDWDIVKQKLK